MKDSPSVDEIKGKLAVLKNIRSRLPAEVPGRPCSADPIAQYVEAELAAIDKELEAINAVRHGFKGPHVDSRNDWDYARQAEPRPRPEKEENRAAPCPKSEALGIAVREYVDRVVPLIVKQTLEPVGVEIHLANGTRLLLSMPGEDVKTAAPAA